MSDTTVNRNGYIGRFTHRYSKGSIEKKTETELIEQGENAKRWKLRNQKLIPDPSKGGEISGATTYFAKVRQERMTSVNLTIRKPYGWSERRSIGKFETQYYKLIH